MVKINIRRIANQADGGMLGSNTQNGGKPFLFPAAHKVVNFFLFHMGVEYKDHAALCIFLP
jgi:hypothetical protein